MSIHQLRHFYIPFACKLDNPILGWTKFVRKQWHTESVFVLQLQASFATHAPVDQVDQLQYSAKIGREIHTLFEGYFLRAMINSDTGRSTVETISVTC